MMGSQASLAKKMDQAIIDKDLQEILDLLKKNGPLKPGEIRMMAGLSKHQWAHRLGRLRGLGLIEEEVRETVIRTPTGRYMVGSESEP